MAVKTKALEATEGFIQGIKRDLNREIENLHTFLKVELVGAIQMDQEWILKQRQEVLEYFKLLEKFANIVQANVYDIERCAQFNMTRRYKKQ